MEAGQVPFALQTGHWLDMEDTPCTVYSISEHREHSYLMYEVVDIIVFGNVP